MRWLLSLLLLAACAPRPMSASPEARGPGEADTLRVLFAPAEGFAVADASGEPVGLTADLMRAFAASEAEATGRRVVLAFEEEPDWRTFYARVRDAEGSVFGLGNVTITEARRAELRFSPPYLRNVAVLITAADVPELAAVEDLATSFAGLDGLAFAGTLHETRLRALRDTHHPTADVLAASSNPEIVERVAAGGLFAYIDAYNVARAVDAGVPLRRHAVADDAGETFGIIQPLGSPWADRLDRFLGGPDGFAASPAYRALLARHLGADLAALLAP